MKNKMIFAILPVAMLLIVTGCGTEKPEDKKKEDNTPKVSYSFNELESDLKSIDPNVQVNEKSAGLVGAIEGYGYILENCSIEVYKFDTNSDQYKKAKKEQKLSMPSFEMTFDAKVDNGYGIVKSSGTCENELSLTEKLN